jgi:hypothetical protein
MTTDINDTEFVAKENVSPALPKQSHFLDVIFFVPFSGLCK